MPHFADGQKRTVKFGRTTLSTGPALVTVNTLVPADPVETFAPLTDVNFVQFGPVPSTSHDLFAMGRIMPVGGVGPFTYTCTATRDGSNFDLFWFRGDSYGDAGFISLIGDATASTDVLTIGITDGLGVTKTKQVTLTKTTSGSGFFLCHQSFDDPNTGFPFYESRWSVQPYAPGGITGYTTTVSCPAGFSSDSYDTSGRIYCQDGQPHPAPGTYTFNCTATKSGSATISGTVALTINALPSIGPFVFQPATISTSAVSGTSVGRFLAATPTNKRTWSIGGADAGYFAFNGLTGELKVKDSIPAGDKHITVTCTDRLVSKSRNFVIPVGVGFTVPSSNMTLTVPTTLENWSYGQTVGTPAVTGIPGTKAWSMTYPDQGVAFDDGVTTADPFVIHPTTGAITVPGQPSNRVYPLQVTCTDGTYTCSKLFNVPVNWRAGATFHVGRGMAAAYPGTGFEHMKDVMPFYMNNPDSAHAGATIIVHPDADPNYYANDNGTNPPDAQLRYGWHGPVKLVSSDPTKRVRCGGTVGSVGEGSDMRGKGFFNIENTGDFVLEGFEVSYVGGGDYIHGLSNIRKNGSTTGDCTLINCYIHNGNNGFESGMGPYICRFTNCVFGNNGDIYVSAGATHGLYIGGHTKVIFENCLTFNVTNGHTFKSRARSGDLINSRFYDGERGSASCQIDLSNGGDYLIDGCHIQKGPNNTNPYAIQMMPEGTSKDESRIQKLVVRNSRLDLMTIKGTRSANGNNCTGIAAFGTVSAVDGQPLTVYLENNTFFLTPEANKYVGATFGYTGNPGMFVESGTTIATLPIALDLSDPSGIGYTRPGWFAVVAPASDNYVNFNGVQQDPGGEDIRISASAGVGTTIATITAYGNDFSTLSAGPGNPEVNPFGPGSTWSITQDPQYYSYTAPWWAPDGRYTITTNSNGTGTLKVGTTLSSGVDFVKVRVVGPSSKGSVVCDHRYYVVKT